MVALQFRDSGQAAQPGEDVALPPQPGDGVPARHVQTCVGPPFLDDHRGARLLVRPPVDAAAAVGVVQGIRDRVGEAVDPGRVAAFESGPQERGQRHPLRYGEHRSARVGHECAFGVLDGLDLPAVGQFHPAGPEGSVTDVHRAVAPAQVAQDVRARDAVQQVPEPGDQRLQLRLVPRVDGGELPAPRPLRVLPVAPLVLAGTGHQLERDGTANAVREDGPGDLLGPFGRRGDVDLPALGRGTGGRRVVVDPAPHGGAVPAGRGPALAEEGEELLRRGLLVEGVVEVRVFRAEGLVLGLHLVALPDGRAVAAAVQQEGIERGCTGDPRRRPARGRAGRRRRFPGSRGPRWGRGARSGVLAVRLVGERGHGGELGVVVPFLRRRPGWHPSRAGRGAG